MAHRAVAHRLSRIVVVALTCIAVLTGCIRSQMGVHVDGDGSCRVDIDVFFSESKLQSAGLTGASLVDVAKEATAGLAGAEVTSSSMDGDPGLRLTFRMGDVNQLSDSLTGGGGLGQPLRLFQHFDIAKGADGRWTLDAMLDPSGFGSIVSEVNAMLSSVGMTSGSDAGLTFSVTLPGTVETTDANRHDGGSATWDLSTSGGARSMRMENAPGASPAIVWLIGASVVVLLTVGAIALAVRRRRHRQTEAAMDSTNGSEWAPPSSWGVSAPVGPPTASIVRDVTSVDSCGLTVPPGYPLVPPVDPLVPPVDPSSRIVDS